MNLAAPTGLPHAELVIRSARLRNQPGLVDIAISSGTIASVTPSNDAVPGLWTQALDADGKLIAPGLIESHLHLEKAYLLDRLPFDAATLDDAIMLTAQLKKEFTPADMRERALKVLRKAVTHGVTHVRCHVEIDDTLMMSAIETMTALRAEVADFITLQIVVFPQDGITTQRHGRDLMRQAACEGADVIGGIPYNDPDKEAHLDFVFDLAVEHGMPLDFHIDLSDDPQQRDILLVIERTIAAGMRGSVTAGHLTSLGSIPAAEASDICAQIAEAGINVVALPATDVYLNGRGDAQAARRGLTPVQMLRQAGANVCLATNNIQNPFTPFGRGNILDTALMLAEMCHLGTAEDANYVLDMMTTNSATTLKLPHHDITVGAQADLAIFDATTARGVLNDCTRPDMVVKNGRVVTAEAMPR
ncbi:amidohydrolase family protein [Saccharopolyspora soli]|uniref:amidohydrolase family protein n=1 Tax=Saccharopolyspora soli TaxID=2926618 RepID=UPI001F5A4612|nr:amidohydrolase family protein [Saccharopolyspora soli]